MTDPNLSYQAFEDFVLRIKDKNIHMKTVRFDKYKHKMTKWVTTGIKKSTKFRKNYTDSWKVTRWTANNVISWKLIWKHTILYLKNIRKAKKDYYYARFAKYKNDIRKTWDTLKDVIKR